MGLRGKDLEKRANKANLGYRKNSEALILQIPVPMILTEKGIIVKESTVDFAGLVKGGKFIAYDAKETQSKTSFPLSNIKQHQFLYLELVANLGGIAFFLIHFKKLHEDEAFYVPIDFLSKYWKGKMGRKSIPYKALPKEWLVPIDDYLKPIINII